MQSGAGPLLQVTAFNEWCVQKRRQLLVHIQNDARRTLLLVLLNFAPGTAMTSVYAYGSTKRIGARGTQGAVDAAGNRGARLSRHFLRVEKLTLRGQHFSGLFATFQRYPSFRQSDSRIAVR